MTVTYGLRARTLLVATPAHVTVATEETDKIVKVTWLVFRSTSRGYGKT